MAIVKDLGVVTAYAYAVAGGYEGTEVEFTEALGRAGIVVEQLENLTAVATTLSEGSEATASYADGVLTFGIPRGDTGATGPQGEAGPKGDTGNGIASIAKTATVGKVDTYTITFTDGSTTTFEVTNGADGDITNVAQAFDATKAYSVGDMVLYQGTLYAFTAAHAAGAWVGSDAQAVILADEVTALRDDLTQSIDNLKSALNDADYYFDYTLSDGYLDNQGQPVEPTASAEKYTSMIEVPADGKIGVTLNYSEDHSMWFIYALYNNNQEFISRTTLKSGTAKNYNNIITISNSNAKFIRFAFRGFNDYSFCVYTPISNNLNKNILDTKSIKNEIGNYNVSFSVQSGVAHSADVDLVSADIKSGETFIVDIISIAITGAQIYAYYNDGTYERLYSGNVLNQIFEAKKDIINIGVYIGSAFVASDGICNINVIKYGIALSLNNINANYSSSIKSINHRGFINAPENTLPAYKLSREMGFIYVETDILWTSDNIPVLLHDTTINRTARNSDGSAISETVNISDITYEQALGYDFGIYKGEQYAGTRIPTFTEFVVLCKRLGLSPYVELKGGSQEQINGLVTIAKRYGMLDDITWISFYTTFLNHVKTTAPNARLGYICDTVTSAKIDEAITLKTSDNKVFIDANYTNLTSEIIESCVNADMPLEVYTVDNINAFTTIDAYVSGYTSNKFIASKELLKFYS